MGDDVLKFDPTDVDEFIKMIYHKETKDLTVEESNMKLEPWQTNKKCLRSLYNLGVKVLTNKERRRKRKQSHEIHSVIKNKGNDNLSQSNLSQISSSRKLSVKTRKKIHTASVL